MNHRLSVIQMITTAAETQIRRARPARPDIQGEISPPIKCSSLRFKRQFG